MSNHVFVYASNLRGISGAGSALEAVKYHGAKVGVGNGRTGNAYAIPTKGIGFSDPTRPGKLKFPILTLDEIKPYVDKFIQYAKDHPELTFNIVAIGCGLASYTPPDMIPMFKGAPANCNLPEGWRT